MRRKLRGRYVLPGLVVVGVALTGLLTSGAFADSSGTGTGTATSAGTGTGSNSGSGGAGPGAYGPSDSTQGSQAIKPSSTISYGIPPNAYVAAGQTLFQANCASCHGTDAYGTDRAPNLVGLGAATVDFWVSTGRMPLAISAQQALRKPPRFDRKQTLQIVAYVTSLAPNGVNGPGIPSVDMSHADVATGNMLFTLNCAACHTITGAGDALAEGFSAPTLHKASTTQVAEAIRTGPGNMPQFAQGALTDKQVTDIVAYVRRYIQHPNNGGGLGLGGIGPVAEGFVALLVGVGGLMLVAFWLGERA